MPPYGAVHGPKYGVAVTSYSRLELSSFSPYYRWNNIFELAHLVLGSAATSLRMLVPYDFSGMRIFLNQVKLGPASVEDLYRTIVQKVHEADALFVPKKPARSRMSRKLPKRIWRLLEKRSQLFLKKLTTGDTEDELAFRKMRNRCKSEIHQWNIRKQATILDLARKNRKVLFKYMRHRRRNKPSAFSLRDRNGEPTSDPIVVSEFYRDHYAGDLILTYALFEQGLANRFFTVDPANTRRGHGYCVTSLPRADKDHEMRKRYKAIHLVLSDCSDTFKRDGHSTLLHEVPQVRANGFLHMRTVFFVKKREWRLRNDVQFDSHEARTLVPAATGSITGKRECGTYNEALEAK
ncbi:hypothetical protein CLF_108868, partial [Clonorchis sinensis]